MMSNENKRQEDKSNTRSVGSERKLPVLWSKKTLSLRIFLAGGIAGAVSRTVTAPLDRIKVMLQASYGENSLNISSAARRIYRESGALGFWRGNGVNCFKLFPETAIRFYVYEFLRASLNIDTKHADLSTRFITGSIAGIVSQGTIYPLEVIKTRIALSQSGVYSSMWDVVCQTVKDQGVLGLYKGLVASALGVIPYSGVELTVYSYLTDRFNPEGKPHKSILTVLFCGAVSSLCGQTVSYPFQLVRTKLQAQGMPITINNRVVQYKSYDGVLDCIVKIVRKRGLKGLYRGICANYMKAIPAISVKYMIYELLKEWFRVGDKMTAK